MSFSVAQKETGRVQLSAPCRLEVKSPGPSQVEVNLYGQNRLVNTIKQPLGRGEMVIIGGDGKRADAWLVVLRAIPPVKVVIQTSVK